jgi:hypothetical protein
MNAQPDGVYRSAVGGEKIPVTPMIGVERRRMRRTFAMIFTIFIRGRKG